MLDRDRNFVKFQAIPYLQLQRVIISYLSLQCVYQCTVLAAAPMS